MDKLSEKCPNCENENNNYFLGPGDNMVLYYECFKCRNRFAIDGSKYIMEVQYQMDKDIEVPASFSR
jgi:hypothetical protein